MKQFLKRLLEHALFTFITIIIFLASVMASIKTWELFGDRSGESPYEDLSEYIYSHDEIAKDLELHSIQIETDTDQLTFTGRLHNSSTNYWQGVNIDVIYYVEDIEMGRCGYAGVDEAKPDNTYYFSSICGSLNPNNLPTKFSYKVFFSSGQRQLKN